MKPEKRVLMARSIARQWMGRIASAEYRIRVLYGAKEVKNLTNLLRSFRDGKVFIVGLVPMPDMGIKEDFDGIEIWSSNHDSMVALDEWFCSKGFETSGVW